MRALDTYKLMPALTAADDTADYSDEELENSANAGRNLATSSSATSLVCVTSTNIVTSTRRWAGPLLPSNWCTLTTLSNKDQYQQTFLFTGNNRLSINAPQYTFKMVEENLILYWHILEDSNDGRQSSGPHK